MSTLIHASLDTMPTELLHRIFDFLDSSTLIFNVRPVSRRLRSVIPTYSRYKFDYRLLSKQQIRTMWQLIPFDHVISLSSEGGNSLKPLPFDIFTSMVHWPVYSRLQSLNLLNITEYQMHQVIPRVAFTSLQSFLLNVKSYDDRYIAKSPTLLSSILIGPNLRRVEMNLIENRLPTEETWSTTSVIEHLILHKITEMNRLPILLEHCPRLETLVLKQISFPPIHFSSKSFSQLKSLIIEQYSGDIHHLETFLQWLPGLTHLKIRSRQNTFNTKQWENFVRMNLAQLTSFEFDFYFMTDYPGRPEDIIDILDPFQSSFWLKEKKWFVACSQSAIRRGESVHLYLSPNISSANEIESLSTAGYFFSFGSLVDDPNVTRSDSESILFLNVDNHFLKNLEEQKKNDELPHLPMITSVKIRFLQENITHTIRTLDLMVDLSRITQIELEDFSLFENNDRVLNELKQILREADQLSALVFRPMTGGRVTKEGIEKVISILPPYCNYLSIPVIQENQIRRIFKQNSHLRLMRMIGRTFRSFSQESSQVYVEISFIGFTIRMVNQID